jgi:hypothetical protein
MPGNVRLLIRWMLKTCSFYCIASRGPDSAEQKHYICNCVYNFLWLFRTLLLLLLLLLLWLCTWSCVCFCVQQYLRPLKWNEICRLKKCKTWFAETRKVGASTFCLKYIWPSAAKLAVMSTCEFSGRYISRYVHMNVCKYVCTYVCMNVWMNVCMYVWMNVH